MRNLLIVFQLVALSAVSSIGSASVSFDLTPGQTVTDLSALGGTLYPEVRRVGLFIGKTETKLEWNGADAWTAGPTGRWLQARLLSGNRWAPAFTLPAGKQLPPGRYDLIAAGFDSADRAIGEQTRISVSVGPPTSVTGWSDMTTAAAMGYCLAKHPYWSLEPGILLDGHRYTSDGFEMVEFPGVVGAVRRNFVYRRTTLEVDEGQKRNSTCDLACAEFGQPYGQPGSALKQRVGTDRVINSGIGDMAAMAITDKDFYLQTTVFAGIRSMGNYWHESDVAQADFCCCHVPARNLPPR
jgi:hypothetical protein